MSGGGAVAGLVGRFAGAAASPGPIATFALPATGAGAAGVDSEQGLQCFCGIVVMAVFKHLTTAQARKQALAECQLFEFLSA